MKSRENLLNKVRAILSKTVDNGCTEAEALLALQTAEKLIEEYEISDEDLKLDDEKAIIEKSDMKDPQNVRWKLCYYIGQFTETYAFGHKKSVKFVGLKSDVDFAIWLIESLSHFVHAQLKSYMWKNGFQKLQGAQRNRVINSFVIGCCARINSKLLQMINERKPSVNQNALVITKKALIDDAIKDLNISKSDNRGRKNKIYRNVYNSGFNAGDNALFGRPVNNGGPLRLIKE